MEREKLVEKHAKAAGLPELKASWVQLAGPSVLNDSVISGAVQFIAVGPPSLITLWDKTRSSVAVKGVAAIATYPLYLNVRNPAIKTIGDFSEKDKIALTSIKISAQAVLLQMEAARLYGDANYTKFDAYTVAMPSPVILTTTPRLASTAARDAASWAANALDIAAPSLSQSRVLPSISVKSSVVAPNTCGS